MIVFFCVGIFLGALALYIWIFNRGDAFGLQKVHPIKTMYQFVNPLLAVDSNEKKEFLENQVLKSALSNIFSRKEKNYGALQAAAYFKDLEAGRWVGINDGAKFSPGFFLKVPIMIAYFKSAENDADILKTKLKYVKNASGAKNNADSSMEYGKSYAVEELIRAMIVNDNDDAANVLFENIDKNALNDIYSDLGIDSAEDDANYDFVSIKMYALLFRILYNSTYLNRTMSERVLEILSETSLDEGIARSLPNNVMVAHKYRVRNIGLKDTIQVESHDCGIIYYPDHPYVLCVMTIGNNADIIDDFFNEISMTIYNDMNNRYQIRKNP